MTIEASAHGITELFYFNETSDIQNAVLNLCGKSVRNGDKED